MTANGQDGRPSRRPTGTGAPGGRVGDPWRRPDRHDRRTAAVTKANRLRAPASTADPYGSYRVTKANRLRAPASTADPYSSHRARRPTASTSNPLRRTPATKADRRCGTPFPEVRRYPGPGSRPHRDREFCSRLSVSVALVFSIVATSVAVGCLLLPLLDA
ncbi:hypothetical protein GCM10010416_26220 [Streptomyces caniferus]